MSKNGKKLVCFDWDNQEKTYLCIEFVYKIVSIITHIRFKDKFKIRTISH